MKSMSDILIVGLGISGEATARYFLALPEVERPERLIVLDGGDTPVLRERAEGLGALGADVRLGHDRNGHQRRDQRHNEGLAHH